MKSALYRFSLLTMTTLLLSGQNVIAETKTDIPPPSGGPASFADVVQGLLPAVVNISSTQKVERMQQDLPEMPQFPEGSPFEDFFEEFMDRRGGEMPSMPPPTSLGSGFVIDAEKGYVVTNNHVVRDAEEVRVTFQNDETVVAEVMGRDEKTDLAVLKVHAKHKLTAVQFGNSDALRVGDWIVAIGNPFGLGGTVTAGIVSARQRDINSGPYDDFIQTDASINRGNSGGPMFDLNGKVIGINTAIFSPSGGSVGIGFAIPASLAKPVINQIIEFGRTRRGWLGVRIQEVTEDIAETLNLPHSEGALIVSVSKGGPSDIAGIKGGDVLLAFNGEKINAVRTLPRLVANAPIDTEALVTVWRDGKEFETKVKVGELEKAEEDGTLGEKPRDPDSGTKLEGTGLTIDELSNSIRAEFDVSHDVNGVMVTKVDHMTDAEEKGLIEGDVIVEVNQQPITKSEEVVKIIEAARKNNRTSVLLLVNRQDDIRFVALKI